jgi:putative transposase
MARLSRSTVVGYPHQVTQRGNYEQTVFEAEGDFSHYLSLLQQYIGRYAIEIWGYCLMRSHVHFVCVPKAPGALAHGFNVLHMRYAQYFHAKKGVVGHLWRGRFLSCMLDERSVFEEIRHIENNPVRVGLVEKAEEYPWSSARHHVFGEKNPIMGNSCFLISEIHDWRSYLAAKGDGPILNRTRLSLKTGRPAGDVDWMHELEKVVGRRMRALPRGRPRKASPQNDPNMV